MFLLNKVKELFKRFKRSLNPFPRKSWLDKKPNLNVQSNEPDLFATETMLWTSRMCCRSRDDEVRELFSSSNSTILFDRTFRVFELRPDRAGDLLELRSDRTCEAFELCSDWPLEERWVRRVKTFVRDFKLIWFVGLERSAMEPNFEVIFPLQIRLKIIVKSVDIIPLKICQ